MKKIWKIFAALSLFTVLATSGCAIYIGGGSPVDHYDLECLNDVPKNTYNETYKGTTFENKKLLKKTWPTSKFKYEKKTYISEYELRDFLKNLGADDEIIEDTFETLEDQNAVFVSLGTFDKQHAATSSNVDIVFIEKR